MITFIQLIVFTTYIAYLEKTIGTLPSISDSTYALGRRKRYLFTIFLWLLAMTNYFQPMGMYGAIVSGALFFTGATLLHRSNKSHTKILHMMAASSSIGISILGLITLYSMWYAIIPIMASIIITWNDLYKVWWIEIVSFYSIIISYFFI